MIQFTLSQTAPATGFYLEQLHATDPANPSGVTPVFLYASAQLETTSPVPEPTAPAVIMVLAILGLVHLHRRRVSRQRA